MITCNWPIVQLVAYNLSADVSSIVRNYWNCFCGEAYLTVVSVDCISPHSLMVSQSGLVTCSLYCMIVWYLYETVKLNISKIMERELLYFELKWAIFSKPAVHKSFYKAKMYDWKFYYVLKSMQPNIECCKNSIQFVKFYAPVFTCGLSIFTQ